MTAYYWLRIRTIADPYGHSNEPLGSSADISGLMRAFLEMSVAT
jgi:hypothetical protein